MRQPRAVGQPTDIFQIIQRRAAHLFQAERILILRLGEMGVQAHIQLLGQFQRLHHQLLGVGEWRARREGHLHHRVRSTLVILAHEALAVGQDGVVILHHTVRRQTAIAFGQVHRTARDHHANAQFLGSSDLDIDGVFQAGREQIMVVGGGRAAGEQQFGECRGDTGIENLRRDLCPDRIERLQPGEQLPVQGGWRGAGKGLIEMMMRADQAGNDDVATGIEDRAIRRQRCCTPGGDEFDDLAVLDDNATLGPIGQDGERITDPQSGRCHAAPDDCDAIAEIPSRTCDQANAMPKCAMTASARQSHAPAAPSPTAPPPPPGCRRYPPP